MPLPTAPTAKPTGYTTTTPSIGGSSKVFAGQMQAQAELLRLSAETEQLAVNLQKIEERKRLLRQIDAFLLPLIESNITAPNSLPLLRKELFLRLAELAQASTTPSDREKIFGIYDNLMDMLKTQAPSQFASVQAELKRDLDAELTRFRSNPQQSANAPSGSGDQYEQSLQTWINQLSSSSGAAGGNFTLVLGGANNITASVTTIANLSDLANLIGTRVVRFPPVLPRPLITLMPRGGELSPADINLLKLRVFTPDVMVNISHLDESAFLVAVRGQVAAGDEGGSESQKPTSFFSSYERALTQFRRKIDSIEGLSDRVRIFLLPEYRLPLTAPIPSTANASVNNNGIEPYSGLRFEPVFCAVSKSAQPIQQSNFDRFATLFSLVLAAGGAFIWATDVNAFNAAFVEKALAGDPTVVDRVLTLTAGLLGIQLAHDAAHFITAKAHRATLAWPLYLPAPSPIGLFGSITRFLDFPKNRSAMFDIAISGPFVGFILSLLSLGLGISGNLGATPDEIAAFPALPMALLQGSYFLFALLDPFLHLGDQLLAQTVQNLDTSTATQVVTGPLMVPMHPLIILGISGLFANACNFLPVGRLDGGRVAMAIGGRQTAGGISTLTLLAQALMLLTIPNAIGGLGLSWALTVLFLQRGLDLPPEDDITPVSMSENTSTVVKIARGIAMAACVLLTAAVFLPVPGGQPLDVMSMLPHPPDPTLPGMLSNPPPMMPPDNLI